MPQSWTQHRARVAALSRDRASDDPELVEARNQLAEAVDEARVTRAIDDPAQLARAAAIVRTALARRRLTLESVMPQDGPGFPEAC